MNAEPVLQVEGVAKKFCPGVRRSLLYGVLDILRELVPARRRAAGLRKGEFWAVDQVDLVLHPGEAVALLGHNGAGKSTLLKLIAGLLPLDRGRVRLHGQVVALIELGAGLNPLLNARENIRLAGQLHGLPRRAAAATVPGVLAFAELEAHADAVLQTYSTGMRARLAYAIAAMLPADILLVDEVLAVGDIAFQRKCIDHMQRFLARGGALLLVSHAINHVFAVCRRAVLLDEGRVTMTGEVQEVVRAYLETRPPSSPETSAAAEDSPVAVEALELALPDGTAAWTGLPAVVSITFEAREPLEAIVGFSLWSQDGFTCIASSFDLAPRTLPAGASKLHCAIERLPLVPGAYLLRALIADATTFTPLPLGGAAGGGVRIEVQGPVDFEHNAHLLMGQLIALDAAWQTGMKP